MPENRCMGKGVRPSFLRRNNFQRTSLDLKNIWRRSAPVRTMTKKDEYMFLDFSNKEKTQNCSKRKRWNRLTL